MSCGHETKKQVPVPHQSTYAVYILYACYIRIVYVILQDIDIALSRYSRAISCIAHHVIIRTHKVTTITGPVLLFRRNCKI